MLFTARNNVIQRLIFQEFRSPFGGHCASSMVIRDDLFYISMMRPGKIHMIDVNTFKWMKSSNELHNPCIIHFANDEKIYVTHVGDTIISIFQHKTMIMLGRIDICKRSFNICKKVLGISVFLWFLVII